MTDRKILQRSGAGLADRRPGRLIAASVGGILIDWEDHVRQHEIEINPDGSIGFLHLIKATKQIETRKVSPGVLTVVDPGVLHELRQLMAA